MINQLMSLPIVSLTLSIGSYLAWLYMQKHFKWHFVNPLLFAIITVIGALYASGTSYESYNAGAQYISIWITPATVALAIKLEKNFHHLKKHYPAILVGIISGVAIHSVLIIGFCLLFKLDYPLAVSFIPKSVTTAIAMGVSESLGGVVSLTVAGVVVAGIAGSIMAPKLFHHAKITHPVAQGIALGASAHAMGTSKAIELGEIQGAMSGLAIIITGITVVILAPISANILLLFY